MFVDAFAIVAIPTREPEADALESAESPSTSPIAIFEAALGICRKRYVSVEEAEQDVGEFLGLAGVRTVSVTDEEAHTALVACHVSSILVASNALPRAKQLQRGAAIVARINAEISLPSTDRTVSGRGLYLPDPCHVGGGGGGAAGAA
jgi:hypothetical protein